MPPSVPRSDAVSPESAGSCPMDILRVIACGSVDDGKSTLIGRLLCDVGAIPTDELTAAQRDSVRWGTQGGALDYALLLDGLTDEREQGITIDVAYRYFGTPRRRYIIADAPGHEQYTRNMVTGASTADAAILVIDAQRGVRSQTRRHLHLLWLLGVRHIAIAVTKMDMEGWLQSRYDELAAEVCTFAVKAGVPTPVAIPIAATVGANVAKSGKEMPWYNGPTLLGYLEQIEPVDKRRPDGALRLPVQRVARRSAEFRGYEGTIACGRVKLGDAILVQPQGLSTTVRQILRRGIQAEMAESGDPVTIELADEIDIARGDMLCSVDHPVTVAARIEAQVVWLANAPMRPGSTYEIKAAGRRAIATVDAVRHAIDIETSVATAAHELTLNEIGLAEIQLSRPLVFEPYASNRELGSFILVDRQTKDTVAGGMIVAPIKRPDNVLWQSTSIHAAQRALLKGQTPRVVWLTGLSGAGKSTIANALESALHARGRHTYLLDGDNLRHGINQDLGFAAADRVENIRRAAEIARLMVDAGLIVIVALISPYAADRAMARSRFGTGQFVEVHVDVPLNVAESRDPKGLYRKARAGEIREFTGISSPYEPPPAPQARIDTTVESVPMAVTRLLHLLGEDP